MTQMISCDRRRRYWRLRWLPLLALGLGLPLLAGDLAAQAAPADPSAEQSADPPPAAASSVRQFTQQAAGEPVAAPAGQQAGQQAGAVSPLAAPGPIQGMIQGPIQEIAREFDDGAASRALRGDGRRSPAPLLPPSVQLYAGEAAVYRTSKALRRVAVGEGGILTVYSVGKAELVMIGSQAGQTNVHLWLADGSQREIEVTVTAVKGDSLADTVRELLGDAPGVTVKPVGSHLVVSGTDVDEATAGKLATLQKVFPQILNFTGSDPVGMRPMVMMDVTIMEFNRNAVEDLGIRWESTLNGPIAGLLKEFVTNDYYRIFPRNGGQGSTNVPWDEIAGNLPPRVGHPQRYLGIATALGSQINLLMSRGKAWVLARPKLSAKSGSTASFLVGGEVPIVIPSVIGQSQVEYKEYGIRLNITPRINSFNQVATSIMAEVSRLDPAVNVQGYPGFLTRRTETEMNVRVGETIVLSGLLDREASKAIDKLPVLGDIPILGRLFRSEGFRGRKTELVVFVTPRIVSPSAQENRQDLERVEAVEQSLEPDLGKRRNTWVK